MKGEVIGLVVAIIFLIVLGVIGIWKCSTAYDRYAVQNVDSNSTRTNTHNTTASVADFSSAAWCGGGGGCGGGGC